MLFGSVWKFNIPKDEFKRRMDMGDIKNDIVEARSIISDISVNPTKYESDRYQGVTPEEKISWLEEHIRSLKNASEIIECDSNVNQKSMFLKDYFDAREQTDEKYFINEEPPKEEA